jgi:hypothetical protein
MEIEAQSVNAADQIIAVQKHRIPVAAKATGAAFMAVLMPIYLNTYGGLYHNLRVILG